MQYFLSSGKSRPVQSWDLKKKHYKRKHGQYLLYVGNDNKFFQKIFTTTLNLIFFFFCLKFPFSSFCLQDEPIKLGPDQYGCPFCQFTTKRKDVMEKHICTHTGKKPFKCSFCSYSAVQNSDLKNHFKRRHAEYYVQDQ